MTFDEKWVDCLSIKLRVASAQRPSEELNSQYRNLVGIKKLCEMIVIAQLMVAEPRPKH